MKINKYLVNDDTYHYELKELPKDIYLMLKEVLEAQGVNVMWSMYDGETYTVYFLNEFKTNLGLGLSYESAVCHFENNKN